MPNFGQLSDLFGAVADILGAVVLFTGSAGGTGGLNDVIAAVMSSEPTA